MGGFRRKTPEELLYSIYKIQRGRLKVYIGAVSGTGKTYHMLREGQSLKEQGIDVVLCAVSTMRRPETVEQTAGLDRVPSIHWMKGSEEKKDLDLDALLMRNPEVVLVDGLAHRNRQGAKHPTRWDDIQALLGHGISVITTVNVYELEEMSELAYKLTGIKPEATIPADTLELADEVRLIDVSPEKILKRLEEGNLGGIKDPGLFKRGNVGKLRELALRLMAEDVNESLEKHREEEGLLGPSGAAERILVSAQYVWNGSIYIRRGQQIAKRLGGDMRVVTFVRPGKPLSADSAAFKRSIVKLAEKVGAEFEELPVASRRQVPAILVRYAMENNVTRIILGHSKMTPLQEFWKGSIVNGILKRIKNVDVFFVADRADHEGERVLPAIMKQRSDGSASYRRLSEQEVEQKIGRIKRGRFKVYIGASPGVGKTYMMLREGNDLLGKNIDVCIGLLETHGRKETIAQVGELQTVPRAVIDYRGVMLEDMDVPAIIARRPEVVLIDELAHTNVPGSKNKKRYEDVLEILEAGISVISTLNVQHLESLNDAVEQITGVRVRETVPDSILHMADEVELIDVAPKTLQDRMREGKIYAPNKVDQALGNFFKTGNLIALRELALREIADDVDERLESWERNGSLRGPWRKREVIFVGVTASPNSERLIRRGFRIAHRLKADWHVLYVHAGETRGSDLENRLAALHDLTFRLGGNFAVERVASRNRIPDVLLSKANEYRSTQMIVGQSNRGWWSSLFRKSVVRAVLRRGRHMDVLVVADYDPNMKKAED
ncbi:histidine kinase [Cohnella sp. CFH 77786]|uniref:universal stress protein n=1 Tax=Cohnella sp. CFH 77786 TaxID=2662265 RepID=UPI001C60D38F|nr:universal stress protein [Cohnella sp. CFH 77786]MBW5446293.1 histidine kinase [Cohnella sp. CFH 77786]